MSFFDHLIRLGYSKGLHQQLKGYTTDCSGYGSDAVYQLNSLVLLALSVVTMLNYYYGVFNNPRFTHRRIWFLNILAASGMVGVVSYFQAASFLSPEKHCNDLHFTAIDCLLFAVNQAVYAMFVCFLCSLLLKWKSIANKKVPF